jgi:beta-glucosidase
MEWLGVGAYRFSIAWPRVLPSGRGAACSAGLDFYDRLVEGLLGAGIRPFVTLNHWDLPQALQDRGGWGSRRTVDAFVHYASVVSRRLGDRVPHWVTHNEPWCVATLGYEEGHHAPGHRDPAEGLRAAHHLLLSHGWAAEAIRREAPGAEVGIVLIHSPAHPAGDNDADREATRRFDGAFNRWYLDPVFRGAYPADAVEDLARAGRLAGGHVPGAEPGDLAAIAAPIDWLGLNYYSRAVVRSDAIPESENAPRTVHQAPRREWTAMGWEIFPQGLQDLAVRIHREYAPAALYVTENGAAFDSQPAPGEPAADARRIDFIRSHLQAAHRAIAGGVPLAGYFHWSLIDNFEWQHGYTKRFGLVWVDYPTQRRVPKGSARWYREVVAANAIDEDVPSAVRRSA